MVEENASKLPIVRIDQGEPCRAQDEVIVFGRFMIRACQEEAARHPEVELKVGCWMGACGFTGTAVFKTEEKTLAMRPAAINKSVRQGGFNDGGRCIAIDAGVGMGIHCHDLLACPGFPDPAGEFHFGELGHSWSQV